MLRRVSCPTPIIEVVRLGVFNPFRFFDIGALLFMSILVLVYAFLDSGSVEFSAEASRMNRAMSPEAKYAVHPATEYLQTRKGSICLL